jgi:hypothetical protein
MNWFRLYARKEDNSGWWHYKVNIEILKKLN